MIIIKRKQCTYYIKDESIILEYNKQFTSFNVYMLQNRKRFKDFKQILLESNKEDYDNINDIIGLATKHGLIGMVGTRPIVKESDEIIE